MVTVTVLSGKDLRLAQLKAAVYVANDVVGSRDLDCPIHGQEELVCD
jgi:hypothetical protein